MEIDAKNTIMVVLAVILIACLAPSALDGFYSANTTTWGFGTYNASSGVWESGTEDTKTTNIWKLLPLIVIVVFLALIAKKAGLF